MSDKCFRCAKDLGSNDKCAVCDIFKEGEKKGRKEELKDLLKYSSTSACKCGPIPKCSCRYCAAANLMKGRNQAFDEAIRDIKNWYNTHSETKWEQIIDKGDLNRLIEKLKQKRDDGK